MKKSTVYGILFGACMGIVFSVMFVQALKDPAGIGIGVCLGVSFTLIGKELFRNLDDDK